MPIVNGITPPSTPRGLDKEVVDITASTTITSFHIGRLLRVTGAPAATITLTLPKDLPVGFYFEWEQAFDGTLVFAAASGATLTSTAQHDRSAYQYARGECVVISQAVNEIAAVWVLSGYTTDANGVTYASSAELNLLANTVASVSWAVAAGASNVCIMTGTLKNAAGATIAASRPIDIYISEASSGIGITADTYSTGAAITVGTQLIAFTANKAWRINTHTNGTFAISITDTAKPADQYGVAIIPVTCGLSVSAASAALWGA